MTRKLMIVDDEESFNLLFKANVETRGDFDVVTTTDNNNVVTLAKEVKPDLILLDILMPGRNGIEISEELRTNRWTKNIPVAFLTSLAHADDARQNIEGSGTGSYFLSKLFGIEELLEAIEMILREAPDSSMTT